MDEIARELERLESDLRKKHVPADMVNILKVSANYPELLEKASWCAAKLGQNKVPDKEVHGILLSMDMGNSEVRENIAWGIGEFAGCGIHSDNGTSIINGMLSDDETVVRGMAAWAAGRLISKIGVKDDSIMKKLILLKNDGSEFVRTAATYAMEGYDEIR